MTQLANSNTDAGWAACAFDCVLGLRGITYLEIQVRPSQTKIYLKGTSCGRVVRHATYTGMEAHAMGLSLCDGSLPIAIFADWIDDNDPTECSFDFDVSNYVRRAVAVHEAM